MGIAIRSVSIAGILAVFTAATALPQAAAESSKGSSGTALSSPASTIALVGATLIDGTGRPPIRDAVILVTGERIEAVGTRASVRIPATARRIELRGRWVMPGMVDAHTHFMESGRIYTKPSALNLTAVVPYADEVEWIKARVPVTLAGYLCAGVTSTLSVGGPRLEYDVRDTARRTAKAPNVYIAHGPIVGVKIGHDFFPLIDGDEATRYVADGEAARAEVQRAATWQADAIKTGYVGGPFAADEERFFGILPGIVADAHARHMPVTYHVFELAPAKRAMAAGVDSLAHTVSDLVVDDEFLAAARDHHIIGVTTLAVWPREADARAGHVVLTPMESRCGDPEVIASWTAVKNLPTVPEADVREAVDGLRTTMANIKRMHDFGIPLAVGVDAGNLGLLHGASIHKEIELMAEAGIPAMDILVAATATAARVAGKESEIGTLERGKLADLIVLTRDPLADVRNLGAIESVMKSGVIFSEQELLPPRREP